MGNSDIVISSVEVQASAAWAVVPPHWAEEEHAIPAMPAGICCDGA